jgi:glycosyltransferase involved in cell wall biosynthesis
VNVLIVSGIWPPDVGGPASHAPEAASFLLGRGHRVEAVVTADAEPPREAYPVHWAARTLPPGLRHVRAADLVRRRARRADVVYTTGMLGRSTLGTAMARRRCVVKLTADPAYERARRWRLFDGTLAGFQERPGAATLPLRLARNLDVRHAAHVICPSRYLADMAVGWGLPPANVSVLPNPAPADLGPAPRDQLRARFGFDGPTLVFAGRLTAQKSLDAGIDAVRRAGGVSLVVVGDGPDRAALERLGGARFLGAQPRERVLEALRAADAVFLPSSWENFPHVLVEALAVGTPVIATDVGGVAEVVDDGVNGLLVRPGDADALAAAIRRFFGEDGLRMRLAAAAAASVERYAPERVYGRLEEILLRAAG